MPRIFVLTHLTSPYQVELFDAIARTGRCELEVLYLRSTSTTRSWGQRTINHSHQILRDRVQNETVHRLAEADLAVFNFYDEPRAASLLKLRAETGKPWCFWGERPGFRGYGWVGQLYRRHRLALLRESHAPIWGIGRFALEQYAREFGEDRPCWNVPYYSNLERFASGPRNGRRKAELTTFLCSGALIPRKGVDLLARAFVRLASKRTDVRLRFVGDGGLRERLGQLLQRVADRIEFTGFRDWDHLPEEYRSADVLCVPSRHDGWGLVVIEGLAAGLPVIASDRTGAALEFLHPRQNGWLIPVNDEMALHEAMADAANLSDEQLSACAAAAVASVAAHTLDDGVNRFLAAASSSLEGWSSAQARPSQRRRRLSEG